MTAALNYAPATAAALNAILVTVGLRIFVPTCFLWSEAMRLSMDDEGVALTRPSGRTHFGKWELFDEVRLRPMAFSGASPYGETMWKLTLMNARKPAISSFINADADQVMFMFPLEMAIYATEEEAMALRDALIGMIFTTEGH